MLTNLILVSISESDSRMYLLTTDETGSYSVQCVQSPSTLVSMYRSAVAVSKHGTCLRHVALGLDKLRAALKFDPQLVNAVVAKKQLNVMHTVTLLESRVKNFFELANLTNEKVVLATDENSNFESSHVNKRLNKLSSKAGGPPKSWTQADANCVLEKCADVDFEEVVCKGKRQRRVFGTLLNSHKWPVELADALPSDGLLLSEVLGEIS